jgi:antitoxin Phd
LLICLTRKDFAVTHSASWTLQDAKAQFSQVVAAAVRGQVQHVTKHGKEAVVILSANEFAALKSGRVTAPVSFIGHLLAMPKQAVAKQVVAKVGTAKGRGGQRGAAPRARITLREVDLT